MKNSIKIQLRDKLPPELLKKVPKAFDILGSKGRAVAIIEIPDELREYETDIAEAIRRVHKNVKSVLGKESGRDGEYRLRDYRLIIGDPDTTILHKESGCSFKLDPRLTYFSNRESTERERITAKIKPNENILVMFSGIGPYPICIAKKHPTIKATAVELNPSAHKFCVENVKINKVKDQVSPILGDVREICPTLGNSFDRVLMPLPKGAYEFLDIAVSNVKPGGILHFYHWAPENDMFSEARRLVEKAAKEQGRNVRFTDGVKVSLFSPRVSKIRIDAQFLG